MCSLSRLYVGCGVYFGDGSGGDEQGWTFLLDFPARAEPQLTYQDSEIIAPGLPETTLLIHKSETSCLFTAKVNSLAQS